MKFKKIYLEITNKCNLNCLFCISDNREKRELSISEFQTIISKIKNYTKYVYLHLKGEPLLAKNLEYFLDILDESNLKTNITTNGFFLYDKIDILKHKTINKINISLQSLINVSKEERDQYLSNLVKIIKLNNQYFHKYIFLRIWNDKNKYDSFNNELYSFLKINFNIDNLEEKKINDYLFLSVADEFEWPNIKSAKISEYGKCLGGIDQLGILSDGTVTICCLDSFGENKIGNIFDDSLENILQNDKYLMHKEAMKNGKLSFPLCMHCTYHKRFFK